MDNEVHEINVKLKLSDKFDVSVQVKPEADGKEWDVDEAIELGKEFSGVLRQTRDKLAEFIPVLYRVNLELAKPGNPHRSKDDEEINWGVYCKKIGIPRRTANYWLANYRIAIGKAKPKEEKQEKPSEGIQGPPDDEQKEIKHVSVTNVRRDDNGNLVIDYGCEVCGLEVQLIVDKGLL